MNDLVKLVPTKPDAEIAEELKQELAEAAKPYLEAATKAMSLGFVVQSNFGPNAFKQIVIQELRLLKIF